MELLLFCGLVIAVMVVSISLDERDRKNDERESKRRNQARPWE